MDLGQKRNAYKGVKESVVTSIPIKKLSALYWNNKKYDVRTSQESADPPHIPQALKCRNKNFHQRLSFEKRDSGHIVKP